MLSTTGLLLGGSVGVFLGLFGGGGSTLAVPGFVYALGYGASEAVAMSLVVVGATSLVGAARAWRAGHLHPRETLLLGSVAMVGAYGGARLSGFLSDGLQLALFGVVLLSSAALMLGRSAGGRAESPVPAEAPTDVDPHGIAEAQASPSLVRIALAGATVGVMTGLVGVGGGFLVMPALLLLGVPMSGAVGSSLAVIAMNSGAGLVGYLPRVHLSWAVLLPVTLAAVAGYFGGERLAAIVPERALRRTFAGFLLLVGAFVLFQNRAVLAAVERAAATVATL